jgi:hypothetical protein
MTFHCSCWGRSRTARETASARPNQLLAPGDTIDDFWGECRWLERDDVQACLVYARRLVGHERVEPAVQSPGP